MPTDRPPSITRTLRHSTLALLAFWLLVGAALYAGFNWHEQRTRAQLKPYVDAGGNLVIPRSPDGHFYVPGEVNHVPVTFLVDTGASNVAVTESTARQARLPEGQRIILSTAGGNRAGELVRDVPVRVGPLARNDATVTIGLQAAQGTALLGQSFLRHFDVQIAGNQMSLRTP